MKIFQALLCALATANPTQLYRKSLQKSRYEKVSEEEIMIRNARDWGQWTGWGGWEEWGAWEGGTRTRNRNRYRDRQPDRQPCEKRCNFDSDDLSVRCEWWCPRK